MQKLPRIQAWHNCLLKWMRRHRVCYQETVVPHIHDHLTQDIQISSQVNPGDVLNLTVQTHRRRIRAVWFWGLSDELVDLIDYQLYLKAARSGVRSPEDHIAEAIPRSIHFRGPLNDTPRRWLQFNLVLIRKGTFHPTPDVIVRHYEKRH